MAWLSCLAAREIVYAAMLLLCMLERCIYIIPLSVQNVTPLHYSLYVPSVRLAIKYPQELARLPQLSKVVTALTCILNVISGLEL